MDRDRDKLVWGKDRGVWFLRMGCGRGCGLICCLGLAFGFFVCSTEVELNVEEFRAVPVVYCLVDPMDSVQVVRVQRSFYSQADPDLSRKVPDSLYFDQVEASIRLIRFHGDTTEIYPVIQQGMAKDSGFFSGEGHYALSFDPVLANNRFPLYDRIELILTIPGLPEVSGYSDFLPRPTIRWPYVAQQYIYMDSTRPFLVQWYGAAWNEVDVTFTVMEQFRDSTVQQSISFEEMTEVILVDDVVQVTFPYDLVVNHFSRTLDASRKVIRRYMGPVYVKIHSGNQDFADFMRYKDGLNDFTGQTYTNLENAVGVIACKWTFDVRPLVFDHFTRQRFAADPRLAKFKFIEY